MHQHTHAPLHPRLVHQTVQHSHEHRRHCRRLVELQPVGGFDTHLLDCLISCCKGPRAKEYNAVTGDEVLDLCSSGGDDACAFTSEPIILVVRASSVEDVDDAHSTQYVF